MVDERSVDAVEMNNAKPDSQNSILNYIYIYLYIHIYFYTSE